MISYADLLTLLFALFVLLYSVADGERARAVAKAIADQINGTPSSGLPATSSGGRGVLPGTDSLASLRKAVDNVLATNEATRSRARVSKIDGGFVVSLAEAGLFGAGEAILSEDAHALIDKLADTLNASHTVIRVEGHTDSTPIATARYPSNWELSSARASAVLAKLVERGIVTSRLSVAGYASERPVADNNTVDGRALNRRVDLVILQAGK